MSLRTRLERSHPGVALEYLRQFLAADPDDWYARRALAKMANTEKKYDEADQAMARCLAERPKDPTAWGDWLEMLEARNDTAGIASALERIPPEADVDGRVWKTRGRMRRQAK